MDRETKEDFLTLQMEKLGIFEKDILEKFILGAGKGGQKINKTSSCVYLKHLPTGIEVKCQAERSRELNRYLARMELVKRIKQRKDSALLEARQKKEKVRRQKRRRTKSGQEEVLATKKKRSLQKKLRKPPNSDY